MQKKEEILIRQGQTQDIKCLVELLKELFSIEADFRFDADRQRQGLKQIIEDDSGKSCVMVAEIRGQVIGMCTSQILISTVEGGPAALIEDMVVFSEHRGAGIGERLLTAIEEWSILKGATRMQLLADKNNFPALDFYKKNGWEKTQLICLRKKSNEVKS
jgi:ribosomal protein S18 acetylase RimI-like enzyme